MKSAIAINKPSHFSYSENNSLLNTLLYDQLHINVLPAKLIVSPLTCTSLIDPTKEDDGAACPLVLLSMSRPGGTPPM